jgi:8-oxo-dGTP pyrophosphatase MutT (NUDIX family)
MQEIELKIIDIEKIFAERIPKVLGDYECYSVLVPLIKKEGKLNLLFEVRSPGLKKQPGEVCFPGGRIEPHESGAQCAEREASEELGVSRDAIKIIAQLDTIHAYSNFALYSFLGEIDFDKLALAEINKKEVESVFFIPLSEFIENEPFIYKMEVFPSIGDDFPYEMINLTGGYNWSKGKYEVPIYRFGEKVVWGLTARIIHNLVKILKSAGPASG